MSYDIHGVGAAGCTYVDTGSTEHLYIYSGSLGFNISSYWYAPPAVPVSMS